MTMSFAESADGIVMMANGVDQIFAWDGYEQSARLAGVETPSGTPALAITGAGAITGEYSYFVRFVDRWGNRSRPSEFSNLVTADENSLFTYSALPIPVDANVVRRQILRNLAGNSRVFYVDIDTEDIGSGTLTSTRLDESLSAQEAQVIRSADGIIRYDRYYRPFDHVSVLSFHINRMFGGGYEDYAEGSISLVNGSANVVGTGVFDWRTHYAGRFLHIPGAPKPYEILSCTPSVGPGEDASIVLAEPYEGAANPWSAYAIRPAPDVLNNVYFSESGAAESWHPTSAFSLPEDGDRLTAIMNLTSFLYCLKRTRCYRFSAESDPIVDGFIWNSIGRGCVNHRTWCVVNETAYIMDEQGCYRFDGRNAEPISMQIQDVFKRTNRDGLNINWKLQRFFHCVHSPAEQVIRWFVSMVGGYLPRQALAYCYTLDRWSIEHYPFGVGASCLGRIGNKTGTWASTKDQPYLAGRASKVWASGGSNLDALPGWQSEYGGVVSTAGHTSITPLAAVGAEVVGSPITITSGRAAGQTRMIVEVAGGRLFLDRALSALPDHGDTFGIGAIPYQYRTHRLKYTESEDKDGFSVRLSFDPQKWGTVGIRQYIDHASLPQKVSADLSPQDNFSVSANEGDQEVTVDMTSRSGFAVARGDRHGERDTDHARSVKVELVGASGPTRHTFTEIRINGVEGG